MSKTNFSQSEQEVQVEQIRGHFQCKICNKIQTKITNCKRALSYKEGSIPCQEFSMDLKKVSNSQRDKNLGGEIFSMHEGSTKSQRSEL
jgi:hypothetical protein